MRSSGTPKSGYLSPRGEVTSPKRELARAATPGQVFLCPGQLNSPGMVTRSATMEQGWPPDALRGLGGLRPVVSRNDPDAAYKYRAEEYRGESPGL